MYYVLICDFVTLFKQKNLKYKQQQKLFYLERAEFLYYIQLKNLDIN